MDIEACGDEMVNDIIISYGGIGQGFTVRFREDIHKMRGHDLPLFRNDKMSVYAYGWNAKIPFEVHEFSGEDYVGGELHFFKYNGENRFQLVSGTNRMSSFRIKEAFRSFGFGGDLRYR